MSVIKPHVITDAMLTSSTVFDTEPPGWAWSAGTTYAYEDPCSVAGALGLVTLYYSRLPGNIAHPPASSPEWWGVINTLYQPYSAAATYALGERVQDNTAHLIYESLADGNLGQALTNTAKWAKVSATGRWAAFDKAIGTVTQGASPLEIVLQPNLATTGLFMFELAASTARVTVRDTPGGTIVYDRTLILDGTVIESVFDWFFADGSDDDIIDVALNDLPGQFYSSELTITLTSTTGTVSAGVINPGVTTNIGDTRYGATVRIIDYTEKSKDAFGNVTAIDRGFSKKASFAVDTEKARFNKIFRTLASMRAIPCAYIGTTLSGFEPLLLYAFFTDFSIAVDRPTHHLCTLEVEGFTDAN